MATNTGKGRRIAAQIDRVQKQLPNGKYAKYEVSTGKLISVKSGDTPFKGVAMHVDDRRK